MKNEIPVIHNVMVNWLLVISFMVRRQKHVSKCANTKNCNTEKALGTRFSFWCHNIAQSVGSSTEEPTLWAILCPSYRESFVHGARTWYLSSFQLSVCYVWLWTQLWCEKKLTSSPCSDKVGTIDCLTLYERVPVGSGYGQAPPRREHCSGPDSAPNAWQRNVTADGCVLWASDHSLVRLRHQIRSKSTRTCSPPKWLVSTSGHEGELLIPGFHCSVENTRLLEMLKHLCLIRELA